MYLADYKDGSIVNLMSSIAKALGGKTGHKPLKGLDIGVLKRAKNIVLIVIDGMGYEYIRKHKDNVFWENIQGKMTSVFPATTAAAVTTFVTGDEPCQHGMTGWFMLLKEIGIVSTILRFIPRLKGAGFEQMGIKPKQLFDMSPFLDKIKASAYTVTHDEIIDSAYNSVVSRKSERYGCKGFDSFLRGIKKALNGKGRRKLVYAYWGEFDSIAHDKGISSKQVLRHFNQIDKKMRNFLMKSGDDTAFIITSDHGFVDVSKRIVINEHPKLQECLSLPLCGDARVGYCYVKPDKAKQFERYVKAKLKRYCWMYKSKDLVKKGWFGIGKINPKLYDRIGDYTLIMKDRYAIKDILPTEKPSTHKGAHSGVTKEEMMVPLIIVRA